MDKSDKVLNFVLPTAYAGSGNISCISGEQVGFSMTALGSNVDVASTCSSVSAIDKDIRVNLLKSMGGKMMRRTVTEAIYNSSDVFLDFSDGLKFGVGYTVPRLTGSPCEETYTFKADGTVTVTAEDQSSSGCPSGAAFTDTVAFQFANGYLEFDSSGQRNFSKSHTMDDDGKMIASYERWEVCGNIISNDALPTSVGYNNYNLSAARNSVAAAGNTIPCLQ